MKRDYRHKIDFYKQTRRQDEYGEPISKWGLCKRGVWASFDPLLGNEYFTAFTTDSKVEVKFNMRYLAGITNDMRIKHNDKTYEILSAIDVNGLSRELLCYCKLVKE